MALLAENESGLMGRVRSKWRRILGWISLSLGLTMIAFAVAARDDLAKVDLSQGINRDAWQLPEQVIAKLDIKPGDTVADIGAGEGYFTVPLARAVGPSGRVFAVDVDDAKLDALRASVAASGQRNVTVVRGEYADPLLPDGAIDLVFSCNTFHHIDARIAYFDRLKSDIAPGGRVVIVDLKDSLVVKLIGLGHHATTVAELTGEMESAGYQLSAQFDFLPIQNFAAFHPR